MTPAGTLQRETILNALRKETFRPATRLAVGWLLTFSLLSPQALALPNETGVERVIAELRDLSAAAAEPSDRERLLDELDYEAERIVGFVRDRIAFQPYHGVLRGVAGTLSGRSGNAHDQALLLAALLRDAGYDAQVLTGELTSAQARTLNRTMAMPELPGARPASELPEWMRSLRKRANAEGSGIAGEIRRAERATAPILESLQDAAAIGERLSGVAHDSSTAYRWVRYRDGAADAWVEVHPALAEPSDWDVEIQTVEAEAVDASSLHQLEVQLWIESSTGEQTQVSGSWVRPAANLWGKDLTLTIGSNAALLQDAWSDPAAIVENSEFFYFLVNDELLPGARAFDLQGNLYSVDSLQDLNSLFGTVNRKGMQAIQALGASGSSDDPASGRFVHRVWIAFRLVRPDGTERIIERPVFEGNAVQETQRAASALMQHWEIDVALTDAMPGYYESRQFDAAAEALDGLSSFQSFLAASPNASQEEIVSRYAKALPSPGGGRLLALRRTFDAFPLEPSTISYPAEPNILAIRTGLGLDGAQWKRYEMTDIVSNGRWSFSTRDSVIAPAPDVTIARGVWETLAESLRLIVDEPAEMTTESAFRHLESASGFEPGGDPSQARIALVPTGQSGGQAWWSIDATSGGTIGMMMNGPGPGGSEITEKALMTAIAYSISAVFAGVGAAVCMEGGGTVACCALSSLGIAVGGLILSTAIGALTVGVGWGIGVGSSVGIDILATNISVNCQPS